MPSIPFTVTVPIGGVVPNVLSGSQFEFLGRPTRIQIYMVQEPAVGDVNAEVFFGQELEMASSPVVDATAAGQGPRVPDNQVVDDVGAGGDRLVIRLTETGGVAAGVVRGLVNLTPL